MLTAESARVLPGRDRGHREVAEQTWVVGPVGGLQIPELGLQERDCGVALVRADTGGMQAEHRVGGVADVGCAERDKVTAVRIDLASEIRGAEPRRVGRRRRQRGGGLQCDGLKGDGL